jgi:hypothetical protein
MVEIDPSSRYARRYLTQLQVNVPSDDDKARRGLAGVPTMLMAWMRRVSPTTLGIAALILAVICGIVYSRSGASFWSPATLDFDDLAVSDSHHRVSGHGLYWTISFEGPEALVYEGVVRHVSPVREDGLPIVTHDVLVTVGDYAKPDVRVVVKDHRFRWTSAQGAEPKGRIDLLHTVPVNEGVHRQLHAIRVGDDVTITGRVIHEINGYYEDGQYLGSWHDTGGDTLLVESVRVGEE